ncbi:MAG: exodeoxyribonuclease VII large subunit [Pyrinomonas sp.]|uniref:exodeoxyribonuclease VII large subunit n=1 Tax=Pyrinomonas sp. TaxID=2080306 RepID=UPI003323AC6F
MKSPLLLSLFDETERRPLTVSELTSQVRGALEMRFASVWVEGEISNFRDHASGHWYFILKDEEAQLRAACFRQANAHIRFRPYDGLQVRARGHLTVYEPRGEYQLCVEALDPVGIGALWLAFEQLRERLAAEGLFDPARKRSLPLLPRRVAVVTSPSGAVIHDIMRVLKRRTRTVGILFVPVRVQGEGAAQQIARAIGVLNDYNRQLIASQRDDERIDVIIIGRGGGSIEDLWAFNEEEVARAIRASEIPVISAVGHETDYTIADLAADLRAPTPSAAAEMVAACEDGLAVRIEDLARALAHSMRLLLLRERARLQEAAMSPAFDEVRDRLRRAAQTHAQLSARLEATIKSRLGAERQRVVAARYAISPRGLSQRANVGRVRLTQASAKLEAAVRAKIEARRRHLGETSAALDALSPLAVLRRGYALARKESGELIRRARDLRKGDAIRLRLAEGEARCRVEEIETADSTRASGS